MTLAAATRAIATGDLAAARDALIAIWRTRRSPQIAQAIAILDGKVPDATSAAIANIVTPRAVSSLANLQKLAKLDDPRLAGWAIDALVRLPFTAVTARDFLVALAKTAARHADPRLLARAPDIAIALSTRIGRLAVRTDVQRVVDAAVAKLAKTPLATTAAQAKAEAALVAAATALDGDRRDAAALLAEIYANPADDAPRLVYADVLTKQGDPRGEFIVLQIERARAGGAAPSERERALLAKHGKAWMGDLAPALTSNGFRGDEFRRGFLAKAGIILSVGKKLRPILAHPAWATVESIDGLYRDDDGLLVTAPLRALRELDLDDYDWLPRLAARTEKLAAVTRVTLSYEGIPARAALLAAFPNLATVGIYASPIDNGVIDDMAALGIDHVELFTNAVPVELLESLVGTRAPVARLSIMNNRTDTPEAELVRDGSGRYVRAR
jgi:uncharacterized protein (TIGR02996 family)